MKINKNQPFTFLFRPQDHGITEYETWFNVFGKYNGILTKVLDEELCGRKKSSYETYIRYKNENPEKMLVLHYNGNERDPRDTDGRYFPGHWLYFTGCRVLSDIPVESGKTVIKVEDTHYFKAGIGRFNDKNDDMLIVKVGPDNKPSWYESEEVLLDSINDSEKTITVMRGQHKTMPAYFSASEAYILPHVTGGPWGKDENRLLWYYNLSTECPVDRNGKRALEILADEIAEMFEAGGCLEKFDGIEFDCAFAEFYRFYEYHRGIDTNGDLIPDGGFIDGCNKFAEGYIEFLSLLRNRLGDSRLIMADGNAYFQQRAFGILNGIESEGFTDALFRDFDWSWGINRHKFWYMNCYGVPFNYLNHKYNVEKTDRMNIDRIAFAAALFTDTYISVSAKAQPLKRTRDEIIRVGLPEWDELVAGSDNREGWLGTPIGPAVRLAESMPDIFENVDFNNNIAFILPIADAYTGTGTPYAGMNYGYAPVLQLSKNCDVYISFIVPEGIAKNEKAILQFYVASINPSGTGPDAKNTISLWKADNVSIDEDNITYNNSYLLPLKDTGYRTQISHELWKRFLSIDITGLLPEMGGEVTFCIKAEDSSIYTLSSREGVAAPKIILGRKSTGISKSVVNITKSDNAINVYGAESPSNKRVRNKILFSSDWFICKSKDLSVFASIKASKEGNALLDKARLVQARVAGDDGMVYGNTMTWANENTFKAGFYFDNLIPGSKIRLEFEAEGSAEIVFNNITASYYPDVIYREYKNGAVIANPSKYSGFTFDTEKYFPGKRFRRIKATQGQDSVVNDGSKINDNKITIGKYDALFIIKDD